ncbi:hypothetical protein RAS1_00820 [Phycisphaerae bacterium RAS1]|nr:hypothetical protein RAS1_00820 [Phycisphaerae bacterium RAS1]
MNATCWIISVLCASAAMAQTPPPATQPAGSRPSGAVTSRKPAQLDIYQDLIREREGPVPILPQKQSGSGSSAGGRTELMVEGVVLVERPGRYVRLDGVPYFVFEPAEPSQGELRLEVLRNQMLELMQREAASGNSEFIVSAEVTRYEARNYVIIRKLLRRVRHGNVGP